MKHKQIISEIRNNMQRLREEVKESIEPYKHLSVLKTVSDATMLINIVEDDFLYFTKKGK